ncbi:MAG: tRNA (adenosine(37)-N6)-threonylcarbamoyltransferase complex ATPase subunit type 1 TsaE [Gammaproteobacteria bacterium]|nr:tRNA (adenosine(37)-N6)-threonylcarbamoyltransferase complex ATPase subunit type 1 TsaE [Gammaproteobacteria bacterium]
MKTEKITVTLADDTETISWGSKIALTLQKGGIVYLQGELGAGKTTLCRGILRAYGHAGAVKSPTYTIIEPYELECVNVYHFDLYRMLDPEEWEYLGVDDYFSPENVCLVEWPDKGRDYLPACDVSITLEYLNEGRRMTVESHGQRGGKILQDLKTIE